MSAMKFVVRSLALAMLGLDASGQLLAQCGHERWSVKTGTDPHAQNVNLSAPKRATIAELIQLTPPSSLPTNSRFAPTETTVFVVNATLTDYKIESGAHGDSDYHLVLQDDSGHTMIAEIPSPNCVGAGSPFAAQIAGARAKFDSQFTVTGSFQTADVPVQITGVGFFDFFHNQRGVAPNVIELHPVLEIVFKPPTPAPPDFTVAISPMNVTVNQGGSSSTTLTASPLNNFGNSITFSAAGIPSGASASVTPISSTSSTLTLSATPAAATGTFPITITGTGGGKSHTTTLLLAVNPIGTEAKQWEYRLITASTAEDLATQTNTLGAQEWELVTVVIDMKRNDSYVGYLKRVKRNF